MPLGIVKDSDYEKAIGREPIEKDIPAAEDSTQSEGNPLPENPETTESVEVLPAITELVQSKGRGEGNTEVPESIRKLIGESAIEEGPGAAVAIGKFLGLSRSSISAYTNGATSTATYNQPDKSLAQHLERTRERITRRAQGKLYKALGVIDDEKLSNVSALEASTIAKNMSAIVKNMESDKRGNGNTFNGPVITFYAPSLVSEEQFQTIDVGEQ